MDNSDKSWDTYLSVPSLVIGDRAKLQYIDRTAVKIIVKNEKNDIILIRIMNGPYYRLPGGEIEDGEDHGIAAQRTVRRDTGYQIVIDKCIAVVEEWRDDDHQLSFCYLAHLAKGTGTPQLTENERDDRLHLEWCTIKDAIAKTKANNPTLQLGNSIKELNVFLLETFAKSLT